jgi:hypothetical protein
MSLQAGLEHVTCKINSDRTWKVYAGQIRAWLYKQSLSTVPFNHRMKAPA